MRPPADRRLKYARIERERRFLLARPPADLPADFRRIHDRYLDGTRLRLRRIEDPAGAVIERKLGQKYAADAAPGLATVMTNFYLDAGEYERLTALGGLPLVKRRYAHAHDGRRFVVDVFEGALAGLVLAEIEVDSDAAAAALATPDFAIADVTAEPSFTGGALARITHADLRHLLRRWLPT